MKTLQFEMGIRNFFFRIESTCATPRGERGQCIQLQRCPSLYNSQQEQIRLYQCGNTNNPQNPFVMPINEVFNRFFHFNRMKIIQMEILQKNYFRCVVQDHSLI